MRMRKHVCRVRERLLLLPLPLWHTTVEVLQYVCTCNKASEPCCELCSLIVDTSLYCDVDALRCPLIQQLQLLATVPKSATNQHLELLQTKLLQLQ
jgi:hypothetical protein